jgi:divalent metal cation (Fe/Co/Zn/Cd) transporter
MLAKTEWFNSRKFGGWGLTPKSWQGWVYMLVLTAPMALIPYLPIEQRWKTPLMLGWGAVVVIDIMGIMYRIKKDEREMIHEAIAERNAMWFMVTVLGIGVAYQAMMSVTTGTNQVDPVIIIALAGATIVKAISHWWLRDK